MPVKVTYLGHTYTYRHQAGWSGGEQQIRDQLNQSLPAGEYPAEDAEEMVVRRALRGILSGGEAVDAESGRHILGGRSECDVPDNPPAAAGPDQIVEGDRPPDSGKILDEPGGDGGNPPPGDPDRILED